ncbi:hypothetical protein FHT02_003166 [Sphingomonas xinjiangensis]|uniref:Uncharacterized protein n=1 Tax=Sphingomonas xinjiangensis TaxID=643568 RepID=A0A840YGE3_9SPHN|nr:hypothetical protein [Sphingomonas xinjiangensis]
MIQTFTALGISFVSQPQRKLVLPESAFVTNRLDRR